MLCDTCSSFDVKGLYDLADARLRISKPTVPEGGGFAEYEGFPKYYKHHRGLKSVQECAKERCQLCKAIWDQFAESLPPRVDEECELPEGEYGEQIFLGLSNWSPEAQGIPDLTAIQHLPDGAVRKVAIFDVYPDKKNVRLGIEHLLARPVYATAASKECLTLAKTWLTECTRQHESCSILSAKPRQLPTRVLDVGSGSRPPSPRLVTTNGAVGIWAALSYCWGEESKFLLRDEKLHRFLDGDFPLEDYPTTLRHAIEVTRYLGIQYLWVDALCIIQNSPSDWAAEAARMKEVYGGAWVTIAANSPKSAQEGFLRERAVPKCECRLTCGSQTSAERSIVALRPSRQLGDTSMEREPRNTRGWALQESLLAPRTLSFGSQQMAWECQEKKIAESGHPILPGERHREKHFIQRLLAEDVGLWERSKLSLAKLSLQALPMDRTIVPSAWEAHRDAMYSRWFATVGDFTSRNLTVGSDALPALSGTAQAFHNLLKDQYCAGLWKNDIIRGLLWNRTNLVRDQQPPSVVSTSDEYRVPSWSWASIYSGPVSNIMMEEHTWPWIELQETAKVLEIKTKPRFADPYGQTRGGHIAMKAPFRAVGDLVSLAEEAAPGGDAILHKRLREEMTIRSSQSEFEQQHQAHHGQNFAVIRITKHTGPHQSMVDGKQAGNPGASLLILETTGTKDNEYRRVGCFTVSTESSPDSDDLNMALLDEMNAAKWQWKKIRIV